MIYIIGAGYMAREYSLVLKELKEPFLVVGRGKKAVDQLVSELEINAVSGGLSNVLKESNEIPEAAIICTPVETIAEIAIDLINFGVKTILLEKPGALSIEELITIQKRSKENGVSVHIGYNRRFYQSTIALEKRLNNERLTAVNFEITEWSHHIVNEPCAEEVKQKWLLANTSHVIDLVTHIAGEFEHLSTYTSGSLRWHPSAARFVGSGMTNKGILFSYCGYWDGPGRWSAEFITTENRYILRPMEKLQVQALGTVEMKLDDSVDYSLDEKFKPGLFLLVNSFLENDFTKFVTLEEQINSFQKYYKIANYEFE